MFFNYNRIQVSLLNPKVAECTLRTLLKIIKEFSRLYKRYIIYGDFWASILKYWPFFLKGAESPAEHMDALFGRERAEKLRRELKSVPLDEKELTIIEAIIEALHDAGAPYVLPFRFKDTHRNCTSHHLILATKHPRGYQIMKDIMAKESSNDVQGVPSFEYNPATVRQALLYEYNRPIDDLEEMLLREFAGRTLTMDSIFQQHNIGRRFISRNYKDALVKLEKLGKIDAHPPANDRRQRKGIPTFGDDVLVTFPKRMENNHGS